MRIIVVFFSTVVLGLSASLGVSGDSGAIDSPVNTAYEIVGLGIVAASKDEEMVGILDDLIETLGGTKLVDVKFSPIEALIVSFGPDIIVNGEINQNYLTFLNEDQRKNLVTFPHPDSRCDLTDLKATNGGRVAWLTMNYSIADYSELRRCFLLQYANFSGFAFSHVMDGTEKEIIEFILHSK